MRDQRMRLRQMMPPIATGLSLLSFAIAGCNPKRDFDEEVRVLIRETSPEFVTRSLAQPFSLESLPELEQ